MFVRIAAMFTILSSFTLQTVCAETINIYTYRQPELLRPFLNAYEKQTGVTFQTVYAPQGLIARLQSEGENSKADIVLTVDISRITELDKTGLLAPLDSDIIRKNVPAYLRDDRWTALSMRARIIAISKDRVQPNEITRIEDLARPEWRGRICTRKGSHVYNRALLASFIAHHGKEKAEQWASDLVSNLARRPQGNDRAQAKAIFSGECDIALMNTYYFGKMKFNRESPEQQKWADTIRIIFFNQNDRGQHVNISGGALLNSSKNKKQAIKFLEWLTTISAQRLYTEINYEYPVNPEAEPSEEVASWGSFKADTVPLKKIAELSPAAQRIIDITGW